MLRTLRGLVNIQTSSHLPAVCASDSRSGWGPSFSLASHIPYCSPQLPQNSCGPLPVPHPPALGHFLYLHQAQPGPLPSLLGIPCSHWEKAPLTFPFCANSPCANLSMLPASHSLLITTTVMPLLPTCLIQKRRQLLVVTFNASVHSSVMGFMLFILRSNERD